MTETRIEQQPNGKWSVIVDNAGDVQVSPDWPNEQMARIAAMQAAGVMGPLRSHRKGGGYR